MKQPYPCFQVVYLVIIATILVTSKAWSKPELVKAFAFGARNLSCQSLTKPDTNYTMVVQDSPDSIEYDAARGWGYEAVYAPGESPYGDRGGYGIFGPFDDSPNNRNMFPDSCPEEIFDSFIGGKNFDQQCNETIVGDPTSPCTDGGLKPEGLIFRVDVPNGTYHFVAAVGDADNPHAHRILAEDGGSGPPEEIGSNYVVLVSNYNQADYAPGVFAWVGFGDFSAPSLNGPEFVQMGIDGYPADGAAASPTLEVTQGYIRIHQLQGNSNDGAARPGDVNGGDMVLLELWGDVGPDVTPPTVTTITPLPGITVQSMTSITVTFDELVTGVDAGDLLINNIPASTVSGSGAGPYIFSFVEPALGTVTISWSSSHGITDTAETPNTFAGTGTWNYELDPTAPSADLVISEFMASNGTTLQDEDGESPDWIEIYNRGSEAVSLINWSLTNDPMLIKKWVFPEAAIGAHEYLVVFASGKNRKPTDGGELHTDFQLNRGGEYLALCDPDSKIISEFAPAYPAQQKDYSYGLDEAGVNVYFQVATPGSANSTNTALGFVKAPTFTPEHGLYNDAIEVSINPVTPDSTILYRMDPECRTLTESNGIEYTGDPLSVEGEPGHAVVDIRAMAVKPGYIPSNVVTASYIFPDYVLQQPKNPEGGFPGAWVNPSKTISADYEMDPDIINNNAEGFGDMAAEALEEVPSIMISMDVDDLFGNGGIYVNANRDCPNGSGANCPWERPCSIEMIYPEGRKGFQVNCGIRMQGGTSRHSVWKVPKLSFRLVFRDDYGPTELQFPLFPDSAIRKFNTLILDAKMNMTWLHPSTTQTDHAEYAREIVCDDWQNMMGSHAAHDIFANLYINGLNWGLYNIHERTDHDYAASYFGGKGEDYDCIKHRLSNVINPDPPNQGRATTAWNQMYSVINHSTVSNVSLLEVQDQLDLEDFCDYILMNLYVGNSDWAHHNWYATHYTFDGLWRYHSWDAEHVLKIPEVNRNVLDYRNTSGSPTDVFDRLKTNPEFRLFFGDIVYRNFFNGGLLYVNPDAPQWDTDHPENNMPLETYMKRIGEIDKIIVVESARWGDYRRPSNPYTRNDWLNEVNGLIKNYFPYRSKNVVTQFKSYGLYPPIDPPVFNKQGGIVNAGFQVVMTLPQGSAGTIYYTIDGSDPREFGTGAVAGGATNYTAPATINATTLVKARLKQQDDTWSALNEALFTVPVPLDSLHVTEVMYHPLPDGELDGDQFEFIELKNCGTTMLDLSGVAFTEGIQFTFAQGMSLAPGQFFVLVSNDSAFATRYPGVPISGIYTGRLDNDFDTVTLRGPNDEELISFTYGDGGWWPREADGEGFSLVPKEPGTTVNLTLPFNWKHSNNLLGSPGKDDDASVPTAPRFILQPVDVTVRATRTATFSIQVYAFPDPVYQWQKNRNDLPGATGSSYTTPPVTISDDNAKFRCIVTNSEGESTSQEATLTVTPDTSRFTRGDVNADGTTDLSDAIKILLNLFSGGSLSCEDAADTNDDGNINIADTVYLLQYLFADGAEPSGPFGSCGFDTTGDGLSCDAFDPCE